MGPGIQVEQRYYLQGQARANPREMMEASMQEVKNWSKLMRPMKMNMKAMSHLPLEQKGLEEPSKTSIKDKVWNKLMKSSKVKTKMMMVSGIACNRCQFKKSIKVVNCTIVCGVQPNSLQDKPKLFTDRLESIQSSAMMKKNSRNTSF